MGRRRGDKMSTFQSFSNASKLRNGLLLGWRPEENAEAQPIWDTSREGHIITIAPTGAGKGVSCIIPALLSWQGPAVVIDPRGENYAVTAEHRRRMGHQVHTLDPFRITEEREPDALNPLDLLDYRADDFEDNATAIAAMLMQGTTFALDPYWDERAQNLIVETLRALYERWPDHVHTLGAVRDAIRTIPGKQDYQALLNSAGPTAAKRAKHILSSLSENEYSEGRTRLSIFSVASSHLGFLRSRAVQQALRASTIQLDDIAAGSMQTIYLVIPPDKLATHGKLLRLWLGTMLTAISRRKRPPPQPTLFLIDEAAQLGPLNELRAALTLMRAYGMRVWTFWQDLSQIQNIYPRDWESLLNNSAIQQYFGAASPQASASLRRYAGRRHP